MSLPASPPSTVADRSSPFTVTVTDSAPSTTWALVRMWPSASRTTPVPAPSPAGLNGPSRWTMLVVIDTTDGWTRSTTAATSISPDDGPIAVGTATAGDAAAGGSSVVRPATKPLAPPATAAARVNPAAAASRRGRRPSRGRRSDAAGAVGSADGRGPGGEVVPGARGGSGRLHRRTQRRLGAGQQRIEHASEPDRRRSDHLKPDVRTGQERQLFAWTTAHVVDLANSWRERPRCAVFATGRRRGRAPYDGGRHGAAG